MRGRYRFSDTRPRSNKDLAKLCKFGSIDNPGLKSIEVIIRNLYEYA